MELVTLAVSTIPASSSLPNAMAPAAAENPVIAELRALDVDGLTPREALARLAHLVERAKEQGDA